MQNKKRLFAVWGIPILFVLFIPVFPWGLSLIQVIPIAFETGRKSIMMDRIDRGEAQLDAVIGQLVRSMKMSRSNGWFFQGPANRLIYLIETKEVPQRIADKHAAALVVILRDYKSTVDSARTFGIINFLVRFCGTAEAKEFLLQVLRGPKDHYRNEVVRNLFWTNSWIGDEQIFDALLAIYQKEGSVDRSVLASMQKVNNSRSHPYLRSAIMHSKTADDFGGLASIVNRTGSNELFDVMLSRMPEFGRPASAKDEQFRAHAQWKKEREAIKK